MQPEHHKAAQKYIDANEALFNYNPIMTRELVEQLLPAQREILNRTHIGKRILLSAMFKYNHRRKGWEVFKTFGATHQPPEHWDISPGSTITEVCCLRTWQECARGINVGTRAWISPNNANKYTHESYYMATWRGFIPDTTASLRRVCIPMYGWGKIRCGILELDKPIRIPTVTNFYSRGY